MSKLIINKGYKRLLDRQQTEQGIKLIEKKIRIPENAPAIQTDEGALNQ